MPKNFDTYEPRRIGLAPGAQVVINGALVTARGPCEIEVGSGAVVMSGDTFGAKSSSRVDPAAEFYLALLNASANPERFTSDRDMLFAMLGKVVAHHRTHWAQEECALCAAAIIAGESEPALASARRMASGRRPGSSASRFVKRSVAMDLGTFP